MCCRFLMAEQLLALLPTNSNALKKIGVNRASITCLTTFLRDLQISKLDAEDVEFKVIHLQIVDLLDRNEDLEAEQDVFDNHKYELTSLSLRLQQLIHTPTAPAAVSVEKLLPKKLYHLEKSITTTKTGIIGLRYESDDSALFLQYEAQLHDYKSQLTPLWEELLADDVLEVDALLALHAVLEKQLLSSDS
uniref:Uncharacterized protein n=1 Tax=Amphimedon queenslandica TaxID=400682 RepID=A0A1X7U5W7_AMPQE